MNKEKTICNSTWKKGTDWFHLTTTKNGNEKKYTAYFSGPCQPFPCFSMETTYSVLASWLNANGWERCHIVDKTHIYDEIDNETGEIVFHSEIKENYYYLPKQI